MTFQCVNLVFPMLRTSIKGLRTLSKLENQYDKKKKVEHLIDFKVQNKIKTKIFQLIPYQMGSWYWPPKWEFKILKANNRVSELIPKLVFY